MYVSTGPLLLRDMIFFFFSFPKEISHLFHTSYVFSHTGWDAQETCEFARPDKLLRGASGVLVILILGFYCM